VCGKIAGSLGPFDGGLTVGLAIRTSFVYRDSVAPFAGLHDGIASSTIVGTAVLLHEDAFCSHLNGLTNHSTQPPFFMDLFFSI